MAARVLAVDVGNSRIKLGLLERAASPEGLPVCVRTQSVPHDAGACREALRALADEIDSELAAGVVAGVNPPAVALVLESWLAEWWPGPLVLEEASCLPIKLDVAEPRKVGIDRVLNAVAANALRPPGRPVVIVDCGTATTVDAVSADGVFVGGAILPGFELAARALHEYTAKLPLVGLEELAGGRPDPIGRETRGAIRSGLVWGQVGAVRELVARVSIALAASTPECFLTGGGAPLLAPHISDARLEPHLALQALALVAFRAAAAREGGS